METTQEMKLKLFISYSHLDEGYVDEFKKHIAPLKNNGLLDEWCDRKISAGQDFQSDIDNNLVSADIICLFISANFLSSKACIAEKEKALQLSEIKNVVVVPIIISPCGWLDDEGLNPLLALPTDGHPITSHDDQNAGWNDVYRGLKEVIETENKYRQLQLTEDFASFLEDAELLTKAHSQKEKVVLDDLFIYPELNRYDEARSFDEKINSELLLKRIHQFPKILIAGENQAGKTSLCKKIFIELRKRNFVPVYITDRNNQYAGIIGNRIENAFKEQYLNIQFSDVDINKIVPLVDNFHFAVKKEKHIEDLTLYNYQVIIVDDIFCLNFKNEALIQPYTHFKINELTPSSRYFLIEKWSKLTDDTSSQPSHNKYYERVDSTTELVNTALGKLVGNGIMPAYPFFVLSVISTYEAYAKPLDQEITSQGYCYQAFIYMYLRKQGVKNDEIEIYMNFLTEFSYYFYSVQKSEISNAEFSIFMDQYLEKFNLPINQDVLLDNLYQTNIIFFDCLGNYSFGYYYLYYFLLGKYFAEHIEENKELIDSIINNLHKDENAYIAIFIAHHSKDVYILDEIVLNAVCLFDKFEPATLSKDELSFFDKQVDVIVKEALPESTDTPEKERIKRLKQQDAVESKKEIEPTKSDSLFEGDNFEIDLRRSLKTVEVMGIILKNRAGSLEKNALEDMFEEAMKVHLRIMALFIDLIKDEKEQEAIIEFISYGIDKYIKDRAEKRKEEGKKEESLSSKQLEDISRRFFWNANFFLIYSIFNKIVHSLGSNKLTAIVEKVCDRENTPASFLLKHGIFMWYNKNLQVGNIAKRIDKDGFSEIAKKVMRHMIVNHCSMHKIGHKEKQRIQQVFKIPTKTLLLEQSKQHNK